MKKQQILLIITFVLAIFAFAYLAKGFYTLGFDQSKFGARDLLERWKEQQYIYLRVYPYGMDRADINPQLGKIRSGGYPPWAFFTGFFIFPNISWSLTRFYQVLLNLLSLGILSRFAYQIGAPFGKVPAFLFVAACLAISSNCTTLNNGQYGLIVNAFLIGVYWLLNRNKNYWAGVLMGIALVKPNISAPYVLALVIQRKFKSLIIAFIYVIFATFYISWLTRLNFSNVIERFFRQIKYVADDGFSGINILINLGINKEITIVLLSLVAMGISFVVFKKLQQASMLTLFAIASVIGRVFTYHRSYDDLMLVFLLLALLRLTFTYPNQLNILVVTVVGLTLWIPLSVQNMLNPYWSILQVLIWLSALIYLFFRSREKIL